MKIKITKDTSMSFIDYPNPAEWCTSIYFVGCDFNCVGCHNKSLQDKNYKGIVEYDLEGFFHLLTYTGDLHRTKCVTLLGGEPLRHNNINQVKAILKYNKDNDLKFKFALYTGYEMMDVIGLGITGFEYLKTGLYDHTLKVEEVKNKRNLGSSNQKMYNKNFTLISKDGVIG